MHIDFKKSSNIFAHGRPSDSYKQVSREDSTLLLKFYLKEKVLSNQDFLKSVGYFCPLSISSFLTHVLCLVAYCFTTNGILAFV